MANDLLVASRLVVSYERPSIGLFSKRDVGPPVLRGVDFRITKGETVGIVGESGSGKTTFGRALLGLVKPIAGSVVFDGQDITALDERARRPLCRRIQMIFQDPMSSLNPRHTIGRILIDPVLLHGLAQSYEEALVLVHNALDRVGLSRRTVDRYSYELSGGQRQRVGIARAVVLRPDFVLADEIVSGLDVSTQAQVLRLLKELTSEMHLAVAFISHDLSVIRSICQRVIVMREGRVVEEGACERVFAAPRDAYTRMLIDAIPLPTVDPGWLTREVAAEDERVSQVASEPATYDVRLIRGSLENIAQILEAAGKKTRTKAVQSVIELLAGHDSESMPTFLKALQEQLEREPEQREPEQLEPEQRKPEERKPEQREPEQRKPEERKPEQREPEERKPEERKPEQREPEERKPEEREPEKRKQKKRKPEKRKPEKLKPEKLKPEKNAVPLKEFRTETIEQYVQQLRAAGTDQSAFHSVIARLAKDKAVRKGEADAVAHAYTGRGVRWPKKQDAFAAIRAHFDSLVDSEVKTRPVRKAGL
jgi:ABC-type oligopeptide transport system ATPase subunit/outer membrane biosynthesis protein TonB